MNWLEIVAFLLAAVGIFIFGMVAGMQLQENEEQYQGMGMIEDLRDKDLEIQSLKEELKNIRYLKGQITKLKNKHK